MPGISASQQGVPLKKVIRILRKYPDTTRQAVQRTINKSLPSIRVITSKRLRQKYRITANRIRRVMPVSKANKNRLMGQIVVRSSVIQIANFKPRKLSRVDAISFQVKRSGGRKRLKKAFFLTANGRELVFQRGVGEDRKRIYGRNTGAVASYIKVNAPVLSGQYQARIEVIWDRQVRFEFSKIHPRS